MNFSSRLLLIRTAFPLFGESAAVVPLLLWCHHHPMPMPISKSSHRSCSFWSLCPGRQGRVRLDRGSPFAVQRRRPFIGWLNAIFNSYDASRVQEVGPERACAEWLLRCGAAIRWQTAGPGTFTKDYNALPATLSRDVKIVEIDATDSAIMELGFPHFYGLTELKRIKFKNCRYMTSRSIAILSDIDELKLEELEISDCPIVSDSGLLTLHKMAHLRVLRLEKLPRVDRPEAVLRHLEQKLPSCVVTFPPHTDKEDKA